MLKTIWRECRMCQWTVGFLERRNPRIVCPVLVIRKRRHKMTWAMLVPRKRNGVSLDRKESSEVHRSTRAQQSHAQVRQRAGDRSTGERDCTSPPRRESDCARETASGMKSV